MQPGWKRGAGEARGRRGSVTSQRRTCPGMQQPLALRSMQQCIQCHKIMFYHHAHCSAASQLRRGGAQKASEGQSVICAC